MSTTHLPKIPSPKSQVKKTQSLLQEIWYNVMQIIGNPREIQELQWQFLAIIDEIHALQEAQLSLRSSEEFFANYSRLPVRQNEQIELLKKSFGELWGKVEALLMQFSWTANETIFKRLWNNELSILLAESNHIDFGFIMYESIEKWILSRDLVNEKKEKTELIIKINTTSYFSFSNLKLNEWTMEELRPLLKSFKNIEGLWIEWSDLFSFSKEEITEIMSYFPNLKTLTFALFILSDVSPSDEKMQTFLDSCKQITHLNCQTYGCPRFNTQHLREFFLTFRNWSIFLY